MDASAVPSTSQAPGATPAAWRDPLVALYLGALVVLPVQRPPLLPGGLPVQLSDALFLAAYAVWGWRWIRGRARLAPDRTLIAAAVFLGALGLSLFGAAGMRSGLVKLPAYAALVLFPALSVRVLTDEARLVWAVRALLAGGALAVAVGLATLVAFFVDRDGVGKMLMCGYGALHAGAVPRMCAPFLLPNLFINYLAVVVAIAIGGAELLGRRAVAIALLAACAIVAALTLSAGMGGFAVAMAAAIVGRRRLAGRPRGAVNVALIAGAVLAAAAFALASIASPVPRGEGHLPFGSRELRLWDAPRPSIWAGAWNTIRRHPILGIGYGARVARTSDVRAFVPADKIPFLQGPVEPADLEAHNVWLNVAGQAGIVGLAAFVALLLALLGGFWDLAPPPGTALPGLAVGLWAAILGAFAYHGLFGAFEEARHVWALLGLCAAARAVWRPGNAATASPRSEP